MQVVDSCSKHVLVIHRTKGIAQREGEVFRVKIISVLFIKSFICEPVGSESSPHHSSTTWCTSVLEHVTSIRIGNWKTKGKALPHQQRLLLIAQPSHARARSSHYRHRLPPAPRFCKERARRSPGAHSGDLKNRVTSSGHPDRGKFLSTAMPSIIFLPKNTNIGFKQNRLLLEWHPTSASYFPTVMASLYPCSIFSSPCNAFSSSW